MSECQKHGQTGNPVEEYKIITQEGYEWGKYDLIKSPHWGIPEIFGNTVKK